MKIQCEICKEIVELGAFRGSADGIDVPCSACGKTFFVATDGTVRRRDERAALGAEPAAASPGLNSAGDAALQMTCPKCDTIQPVAQACRRCGLQRARFIRFVQEAAQEAAQEATETVPDVVEKTWQDCLDRWDHKDTHEAFAAAVTERKAYVFGARCYRRILREDPGDATATSQLGRMVRMAEVDFLTNSLARKAAPGTEDQPYKRLIFAILFLVILGGLGGMYAMVRTEQSPDTGKASGRPSATAPR